jgi:hypothetical protein
LRRQPGNKVGLQGDFDDIARQKLRILIDDISFAALVAGTKDGELRLAARPRTNCDRTMPT